MKNKVLLLTLLLSGLTLSACDNESSSSTRQEENKSDFQIACESSGGTYQSELRCSCSSTVCDEGAVCNFITKACTSEATEPTGKCTTGRTKCVSSKLYECVDEQWESASDSSSANCVNGCLPDNSGCAECLNDICTDGKLQVCEQGKLGTISNCENNECAADGKSCLQNCQDGDTICRDGLLKTCHDGEFDKGTPCENNNSCVSATECGECINGSAKCSNNAENVGQLEICESGRYQTKTCESNSSCSSDSECGECINGESKCVNDDDTKTGSMITCKNGKYGEGTSCENDNSCASDTECGECIDGNISRCQNDGLNENIGQITICTAGKYTESTCESNYSCSSDISCGNCSEGTILCVNDEMENGHSKTCISGEYNIEDCKNGFSCDGQECGECHNGDIRCSNNERNIGQIEICENGKYKLQELCESNNSCASETECGECWNGNTLCENDPETQVGQSQKCIEGKYVKGGAFADGTFLKGMSCGGVSCLKNICGYCLNGTHKWCDAKDPQLTSVWECQDGGISKTLCSGVEPGSRCHSSTSGDAYCAK